LLGTEDLLEKGLLIHVDQRAGLGELL